MTLWALWDIDGVLADCRHRLEHVRGKNRDYDLFHSLCDKDPLIEHYAHIMVGWRRLEPWNRVALVTGRTDNERVRTLEWLKRHKLFPRYVDELHMRPHGDSSPSEDFKSAVLSSFNAARDRAVAYAVDDRQKIIDMYRARGVPTLTTYVEDHHDAV